MYTSVPEANGSVIFLVILVKTGKEERFPFVWKNRSFWCDNKWNSPSHWKFFGKKGIASDVVLFSRFYRNDRNITEPFASSHSRTMLLGEMRGSFPKIASGKNVTVPFDSTTVQLFFSHTYCSIWRKIPTGFSIQMESARGLRLQPFPPFSRKIPSGKDCYICCPTRTTGFSIQMESAPGNMKNKKKLAF